MKYSVSTWIYGNQDIEATFRTLKELGFDAIELKGEPDAYSTDGLRKLSSRYGIEMISIAGIYPWPTNERDLSSPILSVREKAIDYLRKCCLFANEIRASVIVVSPTPVGKVLPTTSLSNENDWKTAVSQEWDFAVASLREASKYAQEMNAILAIEPLNRYETFLVNNVEQALNLISQVNSPFVKLHLDTFHMNIEEPSLIEAIEAGKDYLVNVHVADSNRQAVGRGHIDFKRIVRTLVNIQYEGPLTLEPLPPLANPYVVANSESYRPLFNSYLAESIRRLKEFAS